MIRTFMRKNKMISLLLIFPFTFMVTISTFSFLMKVLLPAFISFWLAQLIYSYAVGNNIKDSISQNFSFIKSRKL